MDIASQQTAPATALDVSARAPLAARLHLQNVLIAGAALAAVVGLVGAVLWAQVAWLRVDSDPPGAEVFADGKSVGHTPLLLKAFGSATWRVRVETPGYTPWEGNAQLEPRVDERILAALPPSPGTLDLDSDPPGATVMLDQETVGTTPVSLADVAAGPHSLTLSAPDYADSVTKLTVAPGGKVHELISLNPLPAHLAITTSAEDASISIDGQPSGDAGEEIQVAPGKRLVRVEAPGHRPWQKAIDLAANEYRSLDVEMGASWVDASHPGAISPLAVIVENEAHARPQAGLDRADIVYEALAEGGITRFLAVYASQGADVVGPVRSARDYFVEWAHEYDAPLVHIGASPGGFDAIASTDTVDLDETRGEPGFWRSKERLAPHNAYTSTDGARNAMGARGVAKGRYSGLDFSEQPPRHSGEPAGEATIRFGAWDYSAGWTYDLDTNEYGRDMNGEPHLDAETGEQLRATNVLLQWVDSWLIPGDNAGRLQFAQVGSGRLVALVDGVAVEGRWQKDSYDAPTRYFNTDGTPLLLYPGPTWIEVIPPDGSVTF